MRADVRVTVLVYREQTERRRTASLAQELSRLVEAVEASHRHDDAIEALIVAGQLETAVLDATQPDVERPGAARTALDALARAAGLLAASSWRGLDLEVPLRDVQCALRRLREHSPLLPREVDVKTPEGYAWYAVHPEAWFEAARRAAAADDAVVVIGLRSIGASLSAIVAAAFEPSRTMRVVVRPRGHPFERRPRLHPELIDLLRLHGRETFLIVDEGPGMSGSSFIGVAEAMASLGVADSRIVLLPAWIPAGSQLSSERARSSWDRWRKVVVSPDSIGLLDHAVPGEDEVREWSAGAWRNELLPSASWPPVQPQHERRKWRTRRHVTRFIGLGRHGRDIADRIARMHDAGLGPKLEAVKHGYASLEFVDGRICAPPDGELAAALARHLEWISEERVGGRIDFDALVEMIEVNLREGLGCAATARLSRHRRVIEDGVPVRIDGRLHPHEWVRTPERWIKLDGFEHHADHFYPGAQDLAWDLAGVAAEHSLQLRDDVMGRLQRSRRVPRVPEERLRFYDVAYGGFRVGYAQLAAEVTTGDEQARWGRERERCTAFVRGALARLGA